GDLVMRAHIAGKLAKLVAAISLSALIPVGQVAAAASGPPLIEPVKAGDLAAIRALIAKKVDINASEPDGTTALHWAPDRGALAEVNLLLNAGAKLKVANRYGATPFGLAAAKGHADVIMRMLQAREDANAVVNGEPVLMQAARAGNAVAVKALLAAGADVN